MIDLPTLIACGAHPTQARAFLEPINTALTVWNIAGPWRLAAFLAQALHESSGFTELEENLWYRDPARTANLFRTAFDTDRNKVISEAEIEAAKPYMGQPEKLANRIYANRMGNGNEASGDGWRFRGRGIFQLTGHDNYFLAGSACHQMFVANPDLVAQPPGACNTAAWFWTATHCGEAADTHNIDAVTARINPAMAGAAERRELYRQACHAFNLT